MADKSTTSVSPIALEDALLVHQVQDGDTEALGRLVAKYRDRVVNLCWRMCGKLDEAQDLTQETFLRVLEKIDSYRFEAAFYTWLFRIAVNECLSHRRKNKRVVLSLHNDDGNCADDPRDLRRTGREPSDAQEPLARLTAREVQNQLAAALDRLDDDQRAVVVLRDIESLDYQQIGEVLDISIGTVKSRLHRARLALRDMLLRGERADARILKVE
jgi:RNA polymerase sigma-70 factor (ECF subfamily)